MAQHARLKIDIGVQVYFCDPQSPWQRGSNENTNGLLRQDFPKGTDLSAHSRAIAPPIDRRLYKERHQIECFFNRLKRFRRIALRFEKTLPAFMGFVHLACAMIWLRQNAGSA